MRKAGQKISLPAIAFQHEGNHASLEGTLTHATLPEARLALDAWVKENQAGQLDLAKLETLDTPGALFLNSLREQGLEITNVRADQQALFELISGLTLEPLPEPPHKARWRQIITQLGSGGEDALRGSGDVITFIGRSAEAIVLTLLHPSRLRWPSISRHISETGVNALPIVGLLAVMISIVIAYQGVAQLRAYGGEELTINLVAVSVLREMAVLITAIMVAGRSGSAFAAEIGVMQAREEIDALKVMGLDSMELLVVPRLMALIVVLPLLTFFSDVMGLLGGAVISQSLLHVSPLQYLDRVRDAVQMRDLFVGLIKAPLFGFMIGVIGCMHGLRVRGSADSVGKETTSAVVKSIFLVIVLDALFSILFEKVGL